MSEKVKTKKVRKWMVFVWILLFFLLLDLGFRVYFSKENLVLRNIDRGIAALPYLFNQMDRHKGIKIAFVGASVMQGYQNVEADRAFPNLIEKMLRKRDKFKTAKCFNLSSAGHNFGDHYSVLAEAIRHDPDLIVVAIHFKSFSQHGDTRIPLQHPSLSAYLYQDPNRNELLKRFGVSTFDFWKHRIDNGARKVSAFYRYKDLATQLVTSSADPPAYVINDRYKDKLGFLSEGKKLMLQLEPEHRSTDYLWKLLPDSLIGRNHEICSNLDFSDSNINWRTFKELCVMARKKRVNVLFYLTPINRSIVKEHNFFDWNVIRNYQRVIIRQVKTNGHLLAENTTNAVDDPFFSDTDHMNMNGHAQLAVRLYKNVKEGLERGKWKPSRIKRRRD